MGAARDANAQPGCVMRRRTPVPAAKGERSGSRILVRKKQGAVWYWRCDCGARGATTVTSFRVSKQCRDCCSIKPEIGERAGTKTLAGRVKGRARRPKWTWRCDCGNEGQASITDFRKSKCCQKCVGVAKRSREFVIGDVVGERTLLKPVLHKRRTHWAWRCVCGNTGIAPVNNLKRSPCCSRCAAQRHVEKNVGVRWGKRVLVEYLGERQWLWRCDCGSTGSSSLDAVKKSESCKACQGKQALSAAAATAGSSKLARQRFSEENPETPLAPGSRIGTRVLLKPLTLLKWQWECDCGNTGANLIRYLVAKQGGCSECWPYRRTKPGDRIGSRTLLSYTDKTSSHGAHWDWVCDCGNKGSNSLSSIRSSSKCRRCGVQYILAGQQMAATEICSLFMLNLAAFNAAVFQHKKRGGGLSEEALVRIIRRQIARDKSGIVHASDPV